MTTRTTLRAEPLDTTPCEHGEGVRWIDGRAVWVDIVGDALHALEPDGHERIIALPSAPTAIVPSALRGLIVATRGALRRIDLADGLLQDIAPLEADAPHRRPNDGGCDPAGRLLIGTITDDERPGAGRLWRFGAPGDATLVLERQTIPNGIAWSADGATLFHVETGPQAIAAYGYDPDTGAIGRRRVIAEVPEALGRPDGMAIDADGLLWVALWGGGRVVAIDPASGGIVADVDVPGATQVSACAFGGDDLDVLLISTARKGLGERERRAQPHAGQLYAVATGTIGLPERRCAF